ncbi:OmpA family protein [Pseudonocardia sp. KRD-184]|uniref:OmpA family protein n=1 Tax=Pseudonocardia oceani TaxID=2792013 RepID=A0ABS6U7W4_9PSEU|nr:OmpA family protein [Pseudonocardia oceani]MBW0089845.1 OmpA family protein [Pseudonocardia oceani]MBW0096951.1 OmpA family protein [Pseudonocardia oceani]MBW0108940.1 OmpA family protein [Pseudonocardia oceani]MBW0120872.1 OmpA family protein [Pseudonocardia oceani]MBW0128083.1 OmpA family protein [Pseudonocardia oceani]
MSSLRTARLQWCAAFLAVPTVLAGVAAAWAEPDAAVPPAAPSVSAAASLPTTVVTAGPVTGAEQAPTGQVPTAQVPTAQEAPVADRVAALVAASPVTFPANSAELPGAAAETVRAVAAVLAPSDAAVRLTGHVADTPGSPEGAQGLSERRAAAVAQALVAGGVDPARITAVGLGATAPLDTLAASRRVEFEIR